VERQEAAFLLCGAKANHVLVETCGYDFRRPGNRVVMTRVAGVSCTVLPIEFAGIPMFRFWLDCSYAVYLWEALYEIVRDHGGDAVGMACLYPELAGS
jgi:glycine cleavage system aminomethyltransferase T